MRWIGEPPPEVSATTAVELTRRLYGLEARATQLYAERDRNFRLDIAGGGRSLLKISNADADPDLISFQVRALEHVARTDPALKVPRVLKSLGGNRIEHWPGPDGRPLMVRMYSWLEGECLASDQVDDRGRYLAGQQLARLAVALKDCNPEGAPGKLPWDHANLGGLRDLASFIDDTELLALVRDLFRRYDQELLPAILNQRRQVIHNDLNPDNILFTPGATRRFAGIIDFGDMIEGPLICDLAVACAYQLGGGPDPLAEMRPMVRGYRDVTALDTPELELLMPLVECRLVATLLIQGSRATDDGQAWDDPRSSSGRAARGLRRISEFGTCSAQQW